MARETLQFDLDKKELVKPSEVKNGAIEERDRFFDPETGQYVSKEELVHRRLVELSAQRGVESYKPDDESKEESPEEFVQRLIKEKEDRSQDK